MSSERRESQSKIEFDHTGIGDALRRYSLRVPLNQREYKWEEEHVLDLFKDWNKAIRKGSYFLGTVVLTGVDQDSAEITDGQQRLATTTILFAAMRDYFVRRKGQIHVEWIEQSFLTLINPTAGRRVPRLSLNVIDNEFFANRIIARPDAPERNASLDDPLKPSHQNIINASKLAATHVESLVANRGSRDAIEVLQEWARFIQHESKVFILKVPDHSNAFMMFETLNDRGLKTSQVDLLKNYLFGECSSRLTEAQQRWASMQGVLESLGIENIDLTYLRHFTITQYGPSRDKEIFEKITNAVSGEFAAIEFLGKLSDYANDYAAILSSENPKWNSFGKTHEYISVMLYLGVVQIRPLMLAVARMFKKAEAEKAFRLFVCWTVRFLIAGGRGGVLEEAYSNRAFEVTSEKIKTARELASAMADIVPSDTQFEGAFATARVSESQFARYYLRSLEMTQKNLPDPELVPNEKAVINLEHVLPKNPGAGWPAMEPEISLSLYRRLGNMVLLQAAKNSVIGNSPFPEKKPVYAASGYELTKKVGEIAGDVWGADQINERQKSLAEMAAKTWPIKI